MQRTIERLEASFQNNASTPERIIPNEEIILEDVKPLSESARLILDYFDSASNRAPKTLRDFKKSSRLSALIDVEIYRGLDELVNRKQIIFDGKDSWAKSNW